MPLLEVLAKSGLEAWVLSRLEVRVKSHSETPVESCLGALVEVVHCTFGYI